MTVKVPDLGLLATIDRAELVALVQSLGLDPNQLERVTIEADSIRIDGMDLNVMERTTRTVKVIEFFEDAG